MILLLNTISTLSVRAAQQQFLLFSSLLWIFGVQRNIKNIDLWLNTFSTSKAPGTASIFIINNKDPKL